VGVARPDPTRCSGRNPTVTALGATLDRNATDPAHTSPQILAAAADHLIGDDPMSRR